MVCRIMRHKAGCDVSKDAGARTREDDADTLLHGESRLCALNTAPSVG